MTHTVIRIGMYKDTLANRRGADAAVLALAEGLRERGGVEGCKLRVVSCELGVKSYGVGSGCDIGRTGQAGSSEVVVFEKKDFERRIKEPWDVMISTGTNELLDLYAWFMATPPTPPLPTPPLTHSPSSPGP